MTARAGRSLRTPGDDSSEVIVYAITGALVTVVFSAFMVSPLVGGALAGYLLDADRRAGAEAGVFAGLLASFPVIVILGILFSSLSIGRYLFGYSKGVLLFWVVLLGFVSVVLLFVVGLSTLGGFLGGALVDYGRSSPVATDTAVDATDDAPSKV
ncbi:MAG: DUF5518 domain-containing protein [Halobacteriota archaeon]